MPDIDKICIVDDDAAIRDALDILLRMSGYSACTYDSAKSFLDSSMLEHCACLVTDIRMPDMDGLELQQELVRRKSGIPMIVMTGHGDVPLAVRAMKAGAIDFLEKPFAEDALLASIKIALSRRSKGHDTNKETEELRARLRELTEREQQVLDLMVEGHQTKMVAHLLQISPRTVEVYRGNIMNKMKARTLAELVRLAMSAKG